MLIQWQKIRHVLFCAILAGSIIACSNVKFSGTTPSSNNSSGNNPGGGGTTPPPSTCSGSSTVNLNVSSNLGTVMSAATANVDLSNNGDGTYSGNVTLNYSAYGTSYSALYTAPSGNNVSIGSLYDNGTNTDAFNKWYSSNQKFSGFFQNSVGALVLSISSVDSNGCASGNVYYMNFADTGAIQSPYRECWFIYEGPYDCRDNGIINKTSLTPGGQYTAVGSFTGLSVSSSFQ